MIRKVLHGAAGFLPALLLLPAMAAEPLVPAAGMDPITLAEAGATDPTAQQAEPQPPEPQPAAAIPAPAPSPWAGTLEIYGFAPLRTTTSISRGATERELSGRESGEIRDRVRDRLRDEIGRRPGEGSDRELLARAAQRIRELEPGKVRSRIEDLRARLADRSFPDQIEIPGFSTVTDVGLGSILEHLTDIYSLRGSVEYNRIGFQADLSYVGLGGQTSTRFTRDRPSSLICLSQVAP